MQSHLPVAKYLVVESYSLAIAMRRRWAAEISLLLPHVQLASHPRTIDLYQPDIHHFASCDSILTVIVPYTCLAPTPASPDRGGTNAKSAPYLQVKPLTSQLAHRGFCSSHFRRLFRHVRQPVLTLCLPTGVGLRGMLLDYRAHDPRTGEVEEAKRAIWRLHNPQIVGQCAGLRLFAEDAVQNVQVPRASPSAGEVGGGPKRAGRFGALGLRFGLGFLLSLFVFLLWICRTPPESRPHRSVMLDCKCE